MCGEKTAATGAGADGETAAEAGADGETAASKNRSWRRESGGGLVAVVVPFLHR